MRCYFLVIFCLLLNMSFAQRPDSVMVEGTWYFVYPETMPQEPTKEYLAVIGLTKTEFDVYRTWFTDNDQRLSMPKDSLLIAIGAYIIQEKLLTSDEYNSEKYSRKLRAQHYRFSLLRRFSFSSFGSHFQRLRKWLYSRQREKTRYHLNYPLINETKMGKVLKAHPLFCASQPKITDIELPPAIRDLPDGNYLLYYDALFTPDNWTKMQSTGKKIAATFSLKDNLLNGTLLRLNSLGDTLSMGDYSNGLKNGSWMLSEIDGGDIQYRRDLFFLKKYAYTTQQKQSLNVGFKDDLFHGEFKSTNFRQSYFNFEFQGQFENGIPVGNWKVKDRQSSIQELELANYLDTIQRAGFYGWFYLTNPKEDSVFSFFSAPSDYTTLSLLTKRKIEQKRGENSIVLNELIYSPLSKVNVGSKLPVEKLVDPFESYYIVYYNYPNAIQARFFRDHKRNAIIGSRYYSKNQLYDTCGFDESRNQFVYKQFSDEGKLYMTAYYNEQFKLDSMVYSPFRNHPQIEGFDVEFSYEFYRWSGDTTIGTRRYFSKNWNASKQLSSENFYDLSLERFTELTFVNNDTILIEHDYYPFAKLEELERNYDPTELSLPFHGYVQNRRFEENQPLTEMKWGDLSFKERESETGKQGMIFFKGMPFSGMLEIQLIDKKQDRFVKKGDKLTIYLSAKDQRGKRTVAYQIKHLLYSELPHFFQLYQWSDEYREKNVLGKIENGIPVGNWVFLNWDQKPSVVMEYTTEGSSGTSYYYLTESKTSSSELKRYQLDPNYPIFTKKFRYIQSITSFRNGQKDGCSYVFDATGDTIETTCYSAGKLDGYQQYELKDDNFRMGSFDNGAPIGNHLVIKQYYISQPGGGSIYRDTLVNVNYVNGLRHGLAKYELDGIHYRMDFKDNHPQSFLSAKSNKGEQLHYFQFENSVLTSAQYFKENTLSYAYQTAPSDSLSIYLNELFELEEKPRPHLYVERLNLRDLYLLNGVVPRKSYFLKYFPNGIIAREGKLIQGKKVGIWQYRNYDGETLYAVDYVDSLYTSGLDTFAIKGVVHLPSQDNTITTRLITEETDFYTCTSDEYYSIRQYIEPNNHEDGVKLDKITRYYYDNGALMSEGYLVNGLPTGIWKYYNQQGGLFRIGAFDKGKKTGRWLQGDLNEKANLADLCMDESQPEIDVLIAQLERNKTIEVTIYRNNKSVSKQVYESSK